MTTPKDTDRTLVSFRLPNSLHDAARDYGLKKDLTVSQVIRKALTQFLRARSA